MSNLNEERLRKFKEMGIPEPMAPIDPGTVQAPVRNLDFAAKLAALKSGQKKQELNTFIEKSTPAPIPGFVPLEIPSTKNKKPINEQGDKVDKKNLPALQEFKAQPIPGIGVDLGKVLYEDDRIAAVTGMREPDPTSPNYIKASQIARGYSAEVEDSNPSNFFDSIKQKLAQKNNMASQQIREGRQPMANETAIHSQVDDEQIRQYITEISTGVCKKLIKQFMSEYLASEPSLIKESDKIKKAEIVKEDIVKIDGRFFKLTPVQVKKK
jgi:hypothetical protein